MILTKRTFVTNMVLLAENFHFNINQKYYELIFGILKSHGVEEEEFEGAVQEIILTKTRSEFPILPTAADWLEILKKKNKALSLKEIAILECASVLEQAKKAKLMDEAITFENQITNAVVESLGGMTAIQKRISNDELWYQNQSFFRKEFEEMWIAFFKSNKRSQAIFGREIIKTSTIEKYSRVDEDGVVRCGTREVDVSFIQNPKRIIPDSSNNQKLNQILITENLS